MIPLPMASPGSPSATWPDTPWSLIRRARAAAPADRRTALSRLLELYYVPVRRFFARVLIGSAEAAGDVAHDLFARFLERDFLDALTHETSFRGFLKLACRRHCANWRAAESASRRAAMRAAETGAAGHAELDAALDEELRRHYVEEAMRRVRERLLRDRKPEVLAIFEARTRPDGSRPEDYSALASRFDLRVYDVQNRLAAARKVFRRELLAIARERADDPRAELRELGLLRHVEG